MTKLFSKTGMLEMVHGLTEAAETTFSTDSMASTPDPLIVDAVSKTHPACFSAIADRMIDPTMVLLVGTTLVRGWCGTGTYILSEGGR